MVSRVARGSRRSRGSDPARPSSASPPRRSARWVRSAREVVGLMMHGRSPAAAAVNGGRSRGVETLTFGPLTVSFDDAVLRPRPWTVAQSEWAAELARTVPDGPMLELASGAGHIGQAAAVLSGRPLVQVDRNPAACAWAERNAATAGIAAAVEVRCGTFADAVGDGETFPLVIADPPYVPTAEISR